MSAINLYTTKTEAFYVKDSQRNVFYEYGGIQLLPNVSYTQKLNINIELRNGYVINVQSAYDDSLLGTLSYSIEDEINTVTLYADSESTFADSSLFIDSGELNSQYITILSDIDYENELIYLNFVLPDAIINEYTIYADSESTYADDSRLIDLNLIIYYTNPFYITSLSEDLCTKFSYKEKASELYQSIGLKTWFRQKSRQSELTTYYESSTKNTVTQAIKTHNLELYESEYMSIDDLILTATILESSYLYIGTTRYSLFEAIKIPELTQQENFGKLKFILSPNN